MLLYGISRVPSAVAESILAGRRTLDEIENEMRELGNWASAFEPFTELSIRSLGLNGWWDCLWFLLSPARRTRSASWANDVEDPLSWAVAGRELVALAITGEPVNVERDALDALRYNTPADVVQVHRALQGFSTPDPLPSTGEARAADVYKHYSCFEPDVPGPRILPEAVRSFKAFYAAASSQGEATFHSIG